MYLSFDEDRNLTFVGVIRKYRCLVSFVNKEKIYTISIVIIYSSGYMTILKRLMQSCFICSCIVIALRFFLLSQLDLSLI